MNHSLHLTMYDGTSAHFILTLPDGTKIEHFTCDVRGREPYSKELTFCFSKTTKMDETNTHMLDGFTKFNLHHTVENVRLNEGDYDLYLDDFVSSLVVHKDHFESVPPLRRGTVLEISSDGTDGLEWSYSHILLENDVDSRTEKVLYKTKTEDAEEWGPIEEVLTDDLFYVIIEGKATEEHQPKFVGCEVEHKQTGSVAKCDETMLSDENWVYTNHLHN